ncbi:hypothetical protein KW797_02610 [Candidatus Parcubacteria bacterium]|nr:hypothetical protein [Candidatus Parcubacteria bacterium]
MKADRSAYSALIQLEKGKKTFVPIRYFIYYHNRLLNKGWAQIFRADELIAAQRFFPFFPIRGRYDHERPLYVIPRGIWWLELPAVIPSRWVFIAGFRPVEKHTSVEVAPLLNFAP